MLVRLIATSAADDKVERVTNQDYGYRERPTHVG